MGIKIRFSEDVKKFVVPRVEEDQIDDLFYQEDEIGEMRHTAFMIECGLEEDPPDGPDIPPIPWGDALSGQQQTGSLSDSSADSKPFKSYSPVASPIRRKPPPRSRSTDDMELIDEHMSPKTPPQRLRLVAAKSGSLHAMKTSPQRSKQPPHRSNSSGDVGATDLNLAFAKTNKASPRSAKRFMRCKSGTAHGLAAAAAAAMKNIEEKEKEQDTTSTRPVTSKSRKLTRAKSGSSHGMGAAAEAARRALEEKEGSDIPQRSPVRRLVATKSGTLHGMRNAAAMSKEEDAEIPGRSAPVRKLVVPKSAPPHRMRRSSVDTYTRPPRPESPRTTTTNSGDSPWDSQSSVKREVDRVIFKNGKKMTIYKDSPPLSPFKDEEIPPTMPIRRRYSTSGSESGSSEFLSDLASDDDNGSNISISTNDSEGYSSSLKPYERTLAEMKKKKVKVKKEKTKESSTSSKTKKLNGKVSSTLKDRNGIPSSPSVVKTLKATKMGNFDLPPAFRNR
jgi:hypothetical protein